MQHFEQGNIQRASLVSGLQWWPNGDLLVGNCGKPWLCIALSRVINQQLRATI